MARLFISAAHKSSGKTTLTLGLCRALRNRGVAVQPFKKGPDYIDPIWHGLAAGQPSYNLDFHMMGREEIVALFSRHARRAEISLIEGNKGLYDGMDLEGSNSNAALAKLLYTPVVLVLDAQGMTRGVAPLLLGYQAFDPEVQIAGVILNKVGGPRHEGKLRAVIERYTDVKVLGAVRTDARLAIAERHLGLMPGNETEAAEERIEAIAAQIASQVDLDAVLDLARRVRPIASPAPGAPSQVPGAGLRLAYAHDRVFAFYYQEDLDTLRDAGVELLPVDTLRDQTLPDCDGLLIGGGFPEVFAAELAANTRLKQGIQQAVQAGLPVYAECGGLLYLARSLSWDGPRHEMVGLVPGDAVMNERPVGRGYALLQETEKALWPAQAQAIPAHEFHYSRLENLPPDLDYAYRVLRGHGIAEGWDGFVYQRLLASYCHRRGSGPQGWIGPFLEQVRAYRSQRNATHNSARKAA